MKTGMRGSLRTWVGAGCAAACLLALAGPGRAAEPDTESAADRAGRITELTGKVTVHGAGENQWQAAAAERALEAGAGVWTQPGASARLQVGSAEVELQEKTQAELATLSRQDAELRLVQGTLRLTVPGMAPGESYQIATPRGTVRVMLAGRFVIDAGAGEQPTTVTVLQGAAQVVGSESGLIVSSGQTGLVTGVDGGLSYAIRMVSAPETAEATPEPAGTISSEP